MRRNAMLRMLVLVTAGFLLIANGSAIAAGKRPFRDSFKTAADGVTKGWLVEYPWPDQSDAFQSWRTLAARLVVFRHGHIVRTLKATDFWNWNF